MSKVSASLREAWRRHGRRSIDVGNEGFQIRSGLADLVAAQFPAGRGLGELTPSEYAVWRASVRTGILAALGDVIDLAFDTGEVEHRRGVQRELSRLYFIDKDRAQAEAAAKEAGE